MQNHDLLKLMRNDQVEMFSISYLQNGMFGMTSCITENTLKTPVACRYKVI